MCSSDLLDPAERVLAVTLRARSLIEEISKAEGSAGAGRYYERWLASFEQLLADKGVITPEELDDRTEAFEFGERDEVY